MPRRFPLVFLLVAAGCATPPPPEQAAPSPVWPPAPETPRVAYVQSITRPADAGVRRSGFGRFLVWLTGADVENQLVKPFGLALDEHDNICLTDTGSRSVIFVDRKKTTWRRWDQVGKVRFVAPVAIARRAGIFYVADSGLGRILVFREDGKLLRQMTNHIERPVGLAIDGDRLLVADSKRHHIAVFSLDGQYVTGFGQHGDGPGEFNFPTHIATDGRGHILVTDSMNGRVQVFDRDGTYVNTIGQTGDSIGSFSRPKGVAVDTFGHVYVVDANFDNIQTFDMNGRILLLVGRAGSEAGQFWLPNGIAISQSNEILVTDSYNRRIQIFQYVGQP